MDWIEYLPSWLNINKSVLTDLKIAHTITQGSVKTDKNGTRADFDTDSQIGRITLWETGECDMEILDVETGDTVYLVHRVFNDARDAATAWNTFVLQMSKH